MCIISSFIKNSFISNRYLKKNITVLIKLLVLSLSKLILIYFFLSRCNYKCEKVDTGPFNKKALLGKQSIDSFLNKIYKSIFILSISTEAAKHKVGRN